jgi:hypothetical protein
MNPLGTLPRSGGGFGVWGPQSVDSVAVVTHDSIVPVGRIGRQAERAKPAYN